jgi:hypothetical protein
MGGDPWNPSAPAPQPPGGMRCDPRRPLPRLDPKQWAAIAVDLAGAAKKAIDPFANLVDHGAAAFREEQRQRDEWFRQKTEEKLREMEREGKLGPQTGAGSPKPIGDGWQARQTLEFLKAQRLNAEKAKDWSRYQKLSEQIAHLEWNLANQGGSGQGGSSGGQGGAGQGGSTGGQGGGQVPQEGNDRPRTDGMQSETPGGAPLAPPPGNQAPKPPLGTGPIPRPDPPRPPTGPPGGPHRTPTFRK